MHVDAAAVLTAIGFALVAAALGWATRHARGNDDAQITYVFARSFAEGQGLSWKGVEVLGTSAPFFAVVLGLVSRLSHLDAAAVGFASSWIALWAAAVALYALGRCEGFGRAGFAAGLVWLVAAFPLQLGGEYFPAIACALGGALALRRDRPEVAGIVFGLAFALRPECGLAAFVFAAAHVARRGWRRGARDVARAAACAMALVAVWLVVLQAEAGAVLPRTLAAKRAQAESALGIWPRVPALVDLIRRPALGFPGGSALFYALAVPGLLVVLAERRRAPYVSGLVAWGALHVALLEVLRVSIYPWYGAPIFLSAIVCAALAVEAPGLLSRRLRVVASVALGLIFAAIIVRHQPRLSRQITHADDSRRSSYSEAAALADRYPDGTTLASWEVGIVAYASRQPVEDLLGLVSLDASLDAVRRGRLDENVTRLDPDLLLLPHRGGSLVSSTVGDTTAFLARYELDHLRTEIDHPFSVFRRRTLPGRGNVLWNALDGRHWTQPAGFGPLALVSLRVAAGESVRLSIPDEISGELRLATATVVAPARVRLITTRADGQLDARELLSPGDRFEWHAIELARERRGRGLTFECAGPPEAVCFVGEPHVPRGRFGAPVRELQPIEAPALR